MRPRLIAIAIASACALSAPLPASAQSASDALRQAWQAICPGATPGSELFQRCAEIRDSGPGTDDREQAAAQGNNLELLSTQGRMVMAGLRQRLRRAVPGRRAEAQASPAGLASWLEAGADGGQAARTEGEGRWALVASVGSGRSERGESSLERAYEGDTGFALLGVDYRFGDQLQGMVAVQRESIDSDFARGTGALRNRSLAVGGALSWAPDEHWRLQASASHGRIESDMTRVIDYVLVRNAGTPQQDTLRVQSVAGSRNEGSFAGADLSLDWSGQAGAWRWSVGGQLAWQRTRLDELVEDNDKGLDFIIAPQRITSRRAALSLEASRAVSFSGGVWMPSVRLGWGHEFADDPRLVRARFRTGDQVFQAQFLTEAPDRDAGEIALGSAWILPGGWQAYASWQRALGHDYLDEQRVDAGFRREF